jgi:hypothetical protein
MPMGWPCANFRALLVPAPQSFSPCSCNHSPVSELTHRAALQRLAGERARVMPYLRSPEPRRPAAGWWAILSEGVSPPADSWAIGNRLYCGGNICAAAHTLAQLSEERA